MALKYQTIKIHLIEFRAKIEILRKKIHYEIEDLNFPAKKSTFLVFYGHYSIE